VLSYVSNRSGSWQVWLLDRDAGEPRQVSFDPVGVEEVLVTPDGRPVWWHDETGSELGLWVTANGAQATPLLREVSAGWAMGISIVEGATALGVADERGYAILFSKREEPVDELYRHEDPAGVGAEWPQGAGGLSLDGTLLCIRHSEEGNILHPSLRVLETNTGSALADLHDEGRRLDPVAWSPVPGDGRLVVTHEREEFERPAIWHPRSGQREELTVDLPGAVFALDWWPDGSALLVRHEFEAAEQLYRLDLQSGGTELVADPGGEIEQASVRPDGEVWLLTSTSREPARVVTRDGIEVIALDDRAPPGHPYESIWFENPSGDRIQALVATPGSSGPFPTIISVHGGPDWHERDRYDPATQAYVDEGFAVALPNYRGSSGYGITFRETLHGNIGFPESEDIVACVEAIVDKGVAEPGMIFLEGWSWGGYLACLNAGLNPDLWRGVVAGIPTGDYVAAHWASSPPLRAWDEAVMGGNPDQMPDLYRERNPMTYVDRVRAPVLVIAGVSDSRCPIEGVTPWVEALIRRGVPVEMYTYSAGHHANQVDEQIRHVEMIVSFLRRQMPSET
jgi:dipeptidyl aminopeptidase/acylaminoacyl peptidase